MATYEASVSSNGQVSIPAAVRRRWRAKRVLVIDKGTRVIVRPIPNDPLESIIGKYAEGPPTEEMRRIARAEDAEREDARQ